ncbi:hypothetical protein NX023_06045 [Cytobacillus firmus]|nr:hypothetical protein [Cytobacillus firmus]
MSFEKLSPYKKGGSFSFPKYELQAGDNGKINLCYTSYSTYLHKNRPHLQKLYNQLKPR